jgi:GNAT superfamily N-acetyltransferase
MTSPDLTFSLEPDASATDIQAVRDDQGKILGGLLGVTYWGWLTVEIFWLSDNLQRKGYGSRMLLMAEEEALKRGCHHAHLDTMDFQAHGFYEKHGYRVFGVLEDLPAGHQRIFLSKSLVKIVKE